MLIADSDTPSTRARLSLNLNRQPALVHQAQARQGRSPPALILRMPVIIQTTPNWYDWKVPCSASSGYLSFLLRKMSSVLVEYLMSS